MHLPCLLLLAGYTLNADAGRRSTTRPPRLCRPPAATIWHRLEHRSWINSRLCRCRGFLKVLLRDGIHYDFDHYHSLELGPFSRLADEPGGFGQVFLQWRIALD
jgi:hypothetical protein